MAQRALRACRFTLVLGSALALSGCLAWDGDPSGGLVADQPLSLPPQFLPPVAVSREWPGAEPVVAVAQDGTIYSEGVGRHPNLATNVNKVFRSRDGGTTWQDITPPGPGQERSNDGFVAVGNGETVYAANVFSLTFQVYRSNDRGDTWTPLNVPRLPALMHRHWILPVGATRVHVAVEALPPGFGPYLVGQRPPADAPSTPNEGLWFFRSDDRGQTWTTPVQIDPIVNFAGQSTMVASADGSTLFVARFEEKSAPRYEPTYTQGHWYLLASTDGGVTWQRREMFDLTSELSTAVPALALDDAGTLYFAWSQLANSTSVVYYASSKDGGRSWSVPYLLSSESRTAAMAFVGAPGPPGVLAVMWYTAEVRGPASLVDAPWHVDYADLEAADTSRPIVQSTRVTPEPVHKGNVCAKGPACRGTEDRRLLDYPWMDFGPDGSAHLVFASTSWDKPSAFAMFARERVPTVST